MKRITKKVKSVKKNQIKMTKLEALANYLKKEDTQKDGEKNMERR